MTDTESALTPTIEREVFLPFGSAAVWRVLTEPELIAGWWAPASAIRAELGHRFTLDMGSYGVQQCEVIAVEPERLLSYTFAEGVLDTTLTWTLTPEGAGTRLALCHDGFDLDSTLGREAREGMGAGWGFLLTRIAPALAAEAA